MLPLVALLAFALFGFAALSTDLGLAAAQQNRFEAAAEAGVLAAFREEARAGFEYEVSGALPACPAATASSPEDCIRDAARRAGLRVMAQVLDPPNAAAGTPAPGNIDPSPGPRSLDLADCGDACWQATADQALPLLFGQGSLLGFEPGALRDMRNLRDAGTLLTPGANPSPDPSQPRFAARMRTQGIPVGGEARAEPRPALAVGRPVAALPGRADFALDASEYVAVLPSDGASAPGSSFTLIGLRNDEGHRVGEAIPLGQAVALANRDEPMYIPLLDGNVVVGFAYADVTASASTSTLIRITRLPVQLPSAGSQTAAIAVGNASASMRVLDSVQRGRYAARSAGLPVDVRQARMRVAALRAPILTPPVTP